MIYTVTANPGIDYYMELTAPVTPGAIHRAKKEEFYPGGKGINVSILLHRLGAQTCALGFSAGESGKLLQALLPCPNALTELPSGMTRINVKLRGTPETAFNGAGPAVDEASLAALLHRLSALTEDDTLVISGNLQKNITAVQLAQAAKRASLVVDTTGQALLDALPLRPLLIKPNRDELGELFGCTVKDLAQTAELARKLQNAGARNVLISMGEDGALLLAEDGSAFRSVCTEKREVRSTVGAGDSMVAGFLYALPQGAEAALRWGTAAGTATAFGGILAEKAQIESLLPQICITKL